MKTILIQITNEWIFLNEEFAVPISETNIPFRHLRFKEANPIYWEVEMLSFEKVSSKLHLQVINFFPSDVKKFSEQNPKYIIRSLHFEPLYWKHLQSFLTTYQKKSLMQWITEDEIGKKTEYLEKPIRVSVTDLIFHLGYVTFSKYYSWNKGSQEHRINLPDSIPEYNYIKPYFSKILGKKTIDVALEVAISEDDMHIVSATSSDLRKIDQEGIQILKVRSMDRWSTKKPKLKPPDQDLFTFEEAMASYGDEALGNIDILEKDLLFHLIEKENVRNGMQLSYLSERIHSKGHKLLMTLVPQFGFVFVNVAEEMNHYIWELLNSHATYVWSIPKNSVNDPIRKIENEIRTISAQGRQQYKEHFEPSSDLFFKSLKHKTGTYSYEEYFIRWKQSLDSLLI